MDEELRIYLEGMERRLVAGIGAVEGRLTSRISGLEERLIEATDAIRDDLTVLGGANDRVGLATGNVRDELSALARNVGDMQRVLLKHGTRLDRLERGR